MKIVGWIAALLLLAVVPTFGAPTDLVPRSSGLYDAVNTLVLEGVIAPADAAGSDWQPGSATLLTRAEFAALVRNITEHPMSSRAQAALTFARNLLRPELGRGALPDGSTPDQASIGGFAGVIAGGRTNSDSTLRKYGVPLGRLQVLGTLGRDGIYAFGATNFGMVTRDHESYTTRNNGYGGADDPNALNGIDNAYVSASNAYGARLTLGLFRGRWGTAYRGDMLISDNAPPKWTVQAEVPIKLGKLGQFRFTQFESVYNSYGHQIYQGGRRLEHPIGDRVELSAEEGYASTNFLRPIVLVVPYYAFQKLYIKNVLEPLSYNYIANIGLTVRPAGPSRELRTYGQIVIDDLQAPGGLGLGNTVPRKIGYVLGVANRWSTGTELVAEYARADRETYTKQPAPMAWFYDNLPQGHPIGPNGREVYVRLGQRIGDRWSGVVELRDRRRASDDFPAPTMRSVDLNLAYKASMHDSFGLQLSRYAENAYPGVPAVDPTLFGGTAVGEQIRRKTVAVTYLRSF